MIRTKKIIGTVAYMGGVPAVLEKFCWAWGQMIQYNAEYLCAPGQIIHYAKSTVSFHSFARNSIVEQMKGDWLLMLDTDHEFEPDIVVRLLNAMNKFGADVVTAMYCHRAGPNSPVIYHWNDDGKTLAPIGDWDKAVEGFQVGSSGAGTLLIKSSVFRRIKSELKESPFEIIHPFGEDHSFFKRLNQLEIKTFAAPSIESPHLDVKTLRLSEYSPAGFDLKQKEVEGFK